MSQVHFREDENSNFSTTIKLTTGERNQLAFLLHMMAAMKLTPGLAELRSQLGWQADPELRSMTDVHWRRLFESRRPIQKRTEMSSGPGTA